MKRVRTFAAVTTIATFIGCGSAETHQELVSRIMPLGVVAGYFGEDAANGLKLVVAAPSGLRVEVSLDSPGDRLLPGYTLAADDEMQRLSFQALDVVEINAVMPNAPKKPDDGAKQHPERTSPRADPDRKDDGRGEPDQRWQPTAVVPYSFSVRGGGIEKLVVGAIPFRNGKVIGEASTGLDIHVLSPSKGAVLRAGVEHDLTAGVYSSGAGGEFQTTWYVSGGKIGDRRQSQTTWSTDTPGRYTVIATARPMSGLGLLYEVIDVEVR